MEPPIVEEFIQPASTTIPARLTWANPGYDPQRATQRGVSEISNGQAGNYGVLGRVSGSYSPTSSRAVVSDPSTAKTARRKRKRDISSSDEDLSDSKPKTHALSSVLDTAYRGYMAELNKIIFDADEGIRYEDTKAGRRHRGELTKSQIGGTEWSGEDKSRFFNALAIYGKDDLVSIAAALGNGIGPVQVREYLIILEDATIEYKAKRGRRWARMRLDDQPAAVEISEKLSRVLDGAAKTLSTRAIKQEEKAEYLKWGKYWLLNDAVATELLGQYKATELASKKLQDDKSAVTTEEDDVVHREYAATMHIGTPEEAAIFKNVPSATLLHLPNFLRLSHNIFMNRPQQKRRRWMLSGPAIRQTALSDFYNIVVSVTKRVISVILFQAETRLRSMMKKSGLKARMIIAGDVEAALEILEMRKHLHDYLVEIPRKYKVIPVIHKTGKWKFERHLQGRGNVSFEEAEEALSAPISKDWRVVCRTKRGRPKMMDQIKIDVEDEVEANQSAIFSGEESTGDNESMHLESLQSEEKETVESELDSSSLGESDLEEANRLALLKRTSQYPGDLSDETSSDSNTSDTASDDEPNSQNPLNYPNDALDGETMEDKAFVDVSVRNVAPESSAQALPPHHARHSSQTISPSSLQDPESNVIEDDADDEHAEDENIEDSDDEELTKDELLAIYPSAFDSSHVTSSHFMLSKQLGILRAMLADEDAEEEYLEARDAIHAEQEGARLWKVLTDEPAVGVKNVFNWENTGDIREDVPMEESAKLESLAGAEWAKQRPGNWRDYTEYVGEWERPLMRPA